MLSPTGRNAILRSAGFYLPPKRETVRSLPRWVHPSRKAIAKHAFIVTYRSAFDLSYTAPSGHGTAVNLREPKQPHMKKDQNTSLAGERFEIIEQHSVPRRYRASFCRGFQAFI